MHERVTSGVPTATVKQFCGGLDLKLTNKVGNDSLVYPVLTHIVSTYDTKATLETNVRVNAKTDDLIIVAISVGTFNIPSGYTVLQQCSGGALIYKYAEYTGSHTITLSGANLISISVFRNAAIVKTASILSTRSSFCKANSLSISKGNMGLVILQSETSNPGPTNSGTAGAIYSNTYGYKDYFYEYMDEFRFSKVARWASNFTVPTLPY